MDRPLAGRPYLPVLRQLRQGSIEHEYRRHGIKPPARITLKEWDLLTRSEPNSGAGSRIVTPESQSAPMSTASTPGIRPLPIIEGEPRGLVLTDRLQSTGLSSAEAAAVVLDNLATLHPMVALGDRQGQWDRLLRIQETVACCTSASASASSSKASSRLSSLVCSLTNTPEPSRREPVHESPPALELERPAREARRWAVAELVEPEEPPCESIAMVAVEEAAVEAAEESAVTAVEEPAVHALIAAKAVASRREARRLFMHRLQERGKAIVEPVADKEAEEGKEAHKEEANLRTANAEEATVGVSVLEMVQMKSFDEFELPSTWGVKVQGAAHH